MSIQITTAFVKQFATGIRLLQQQRPSRFRGAVMVDGNITGDREFFDQVGATAMQDVTNRHGDTEYTDTPHSRRMVTLSPKEVADLVDRPDKVRTLNDPTNTYVRAFAAAANRKIDDVIIAAFFATASTGVDGTGSSAFDTNFSIASGSAGMGLVKLTQARELLEAAENDEEGDDSSWHIAMSARQRRDLLAVTQVTSADYNTIKALVNGQINTFLGFEFHKSERLETVSSERAVPAWVKQSMQLAIGAEPRGFIDVMPGKRHSTQVRYELDLGATRMDEKGVVRIFNTEA